MKTPAERGLTGALFLGISVLMIAGCGAGQQTKYSVVQTTTLVLSSTAFGEGDKIPVKYTCSGQNISPPLAWAGADAGTKSFVLTVIDPDTARGNFTHWVVFNLPPGIKQLSEGAATQLPPPGKQGQNGSGNPVYIGPCPPPGNPHRYQFTLYALDTPLSLDAGATLQSVTDGMTGHILGQSRLTGIFERYD
jgi:Raf kinase inhibitor-like YbhB/YbcL family protein